MNLCWLSFAIFALVNEQPETMSLEGRGHISYASHNTWGAWGVFRRLCPLTPAGKPFEARKPVIPRTQQQEAHDSQVTPGFQIPFPASLSWYLLCLETLITQ